MFVYVNSQLERALSTLYFPVTFSIFSGPVASLRAGRLPTPMVTFNTDTVSSWLRTSLQILTVILLEIEFILNYLFFNNVIGLFIIVVV